MRLVLLTLVAAASLVSALATVRLHRADERANGLCGALLVDGYTLIRSQAADADLADETYAATLTHHRDPSCDADAVGVTGALSSRTPDVRVIDGDLAFGNVRAGETTPSRDAFTVRKRRGTPLGPAQIDWRIAARADRLVPRSWVGTWRVTTRFVDLATGRLDALDTFTDAITQDDAIGLSAAGNDVRCTSAVQAGGFELACDLNANADGCIRKGRFDFAGTVEDEAISGRGAWTQTAIGACGWFAANAGQSVEIDAHRTREAAPVPAGGSATTLLMKVAHDPALLQYALR